MRLAAIGLLSIVAIVIFFQGNRTHSAPPASWETGYWFWEGGSADVLANPPVVDALFAQVGSINRSRPGDPWHVWANLPGQLPDARNYWLVIRCERQQVPDLTVAPDLARRVFQLRERARQMHWNVVGVQLDIDSPTGSLPQYAALLREVRKGLPKDLQISITGLLEWFRDGTSIGDVIKEVDEFVPQFYDISGTLPANEAPIAAAIDAAKWGPRFARFGKRFRIGISAFGRARLIDNSGSTNRRLYATFGDVGPIDIATNPAFALEASHNATSEVVLNYRALRSVKVEWNNFKAGDTLRFTLPTAEMIRTSVESARRMAGCAGVVFFRWPGRGDQLVMQPGEALMAAGLSSAAKVKPSIESMDGGCAVVKCVDLYLLDANALAPERARYRIRSSTELDYFLPEKKLPIRMTGASDLELSLPPYCGQHRMLLGRAVTKRAGEFAVEEVR